MNTKFLWRKTYKTLPLRSNSRVEMRYACYILPRLFKELHKQPTNRLVNIIKKLNTSVLNLFTAYDKAQRAYNILINKSERGISITSVGDFIDELLTPSQGKSGCSDFEYEVRKEYYKTDKTFCNYIYCRYWFDNEEWGNCVRFVIAESAEDKGWTLEKMGEIKNALGRGVLTRERVRQIEVEAVKTFVKNLKEEKEWSTLVDYFVKIAKGDDEYGVRSESSIGDTERKINLHRRINQTNSGTT